MKLWTCPCGAVNSSSRQCEACGKARSAGAPTEPQEPTPTDWRCTWIADGKRCYMAGSIGTKTRRCTWHDFIPNRPQLAQVYDEFERWVTHTLEAKYCCEWTHHRAHELWQAVHGHADLPPFPSPCLSSSCRHAEARGTGRTEAMRAIQARLELEPVEPGAPGV